MLAWRATKKNLLTVAARNREEHFQSYFSDWLWCYQCNDSAKHYFQIQLNSNWTFWKLIVLAWRATKKNLLTVAARNIEEQSYLLDWLWCYQCNDSAKYHFQIHLTSNWKFWLPSLLAWKSHEIKKWLTVTARNTEEHFQSYLSDWLWCYQCSDSARYHFQIHLTSNWNFV